MNNSQPGPRHCWPILIQKTQREKASAQERWQAAQAQLAKLQGHQQRLLDMLNDYKRQHDEVQTQSHHMSESLNYRRFIDQLGTLRERVERDLAVAKAQCDQAKAEVSSMELEINKLDKLQEKDQQRVRQLLDKREQSRLDEWGVMRFQLGKQGA